MRFYLWLATLLTTSTPFLAQANGEDFKEGIEQCLYQARQYADFQKECASFSEQKISMEDTNYNSVLQYISQYKYIYNSQDNIGYMNKTKANINRLKRIANGTETVEPMLSDLLDERLCDIKILGDDKARSKISRFDRIDDKERRDNSISGAVTY